MLVYLLAISIKNNLTILMSCSILGIKNSSEKSIYRDQLIIIQSIRIGEKDGKA